MIYMYFQILDMLFQQYVCCIWFDYELKRIKLSCIMRKPDFCLCENKGVDQLRSNCEADQHLFFRYKDSTISLLLKSQILSFCLYRPLCVRSGRKPRRPVLRHSSIILNILEAALKNYAHGALISTNTIGLVTKTENNAVSYMSCYCPLWWLDGNIGPHPSMPKEIDGLHVPPGKASLLLSADCPSDYSWATQV